MLLGIQQILPMLNVPQTAVISEILSLLYVYVFLPPPTYTHIQSYQYKILFNLINHLSLLATAEAFLNYTLYHLSSEN